MEQGVISQGRDEYALSRLRGIPKGRGITTPRWLVLPAGIVSVALAVTALFHHSGSDGLLTLTTEKAVAFFAVGILWIWIATTWSYMVRKSLTRFFGWCLIALAVAGIVVDEEAWFINMPWETVLYGALGVAFLATGYWNRPFDYRD